MLRPFPGFATYPTHHCVTGSLKRVYDYHRYPISEDLLLGLGRGLGFVYFHIKGTDPFYGGRANFASPKDEGLEKTVGRRTGVAVESHATSSTSKAQAKRHARRSDSPPAIRSMAGSPVVAAYDPDTGRVLVASLHGALHDLGGLGQRLVESLFDGRLADRETG